MNSRTMAAGAKRSFEPLADRPLALLDRCPVYQPTPLRELPALAEAHNIKKLWVKDETHRMRLGSFKALGGVFAVCQIIKDLAGVEDLELPESRNHAAGIVFATASAGNHGLSVAAGAAIFGAQAVVVLDSTVPPAFADRIGKTGASVIRLPGNYEDAVAYVNAEAEDKGWIVLADGSWPGYTTRPALVMEGYTVLAHELRVAFEQAGEWPTHVYLQAGVGGLAAAVAANIRESWAVQPIVIVVEPDKAACLLESVRKGALQRATGGSSNMGRLDCKDASLIAFESLQQDADAFELITDEQASDAVRLFAEHGVETTPSGAAPLAALAADRPGSDARCLVIATECPTTAD